MLKSELCCGSLDRCRLCVFLFNARTMRLKTSTPSFCYHFYVITALFVHLHLHTVSPCFIFICWIKWYHSQSRCGTASWSALAHKNVLLSVCADHWHRPVWGIWADKGDPVLSPFVVPAEPASLVGHAAGTTARGLSDWAPWCARWGWKCIHIRVY